MNDKRHQNAFVMLSDDKDKPFRYIKSSIVLKESPKDVLTICQNYDVVILHSWLCIPQEFIKQIPMSCTVVWYAWGWDIYESGMIPIPLYQEETVRFLNRGKSKLRIGISKFKKEIERKYNQRALNDAIKRIDYFSGVYPYETELLRKYQPSLTAKHLDYYYGSLDFFIKDDYEKNVETQKVNILIGNSANPTNNHLDILKALSGINLDANAKIIIPLSYGGSVDYVNEVKRVANRLFPDRVLFLDSFMPFDEYVKIMSNCKIAFYGHERQQASDNIFMQLNYGAKVFLSEGSLAFDYLNSLGLKVYSIQNEIKSAEGLISKDEVINNRKVLCKYYSNSSIIQRVFTINDIIQKSRK